MRKRDRRWPHTIVAVSILVAAFCATLVLRAAENDVSDTAPLKLWYRTPAKEWVEALPVGNGRLGAMVFGQPTVERLQLNEGTLWAGGPYDPVHPEAKAALPEVRRLIVQGKYRDADQLIGEKVMARPLQ